MSYAANKQDLRKKIAEIKELPSMPTISNKLVTLRDDPDAGIDDLSNIIKLDPALSSKLVHYAASPFFGYSKGIESIENAVSQVLGFDKALNMALAMDTSQSFDVPLEGPIGLKAVWRQALFSAHLMQSLSEKLPPANATKPGMVYMVGLLHNIGFLLLGHLFKEEFQLLNKLAKENPKISIVDLETRALGMSHTDLGVWLMREWSMPAELTTAVFEHHNPFYKGQHFVYANLALIANRLLCRHDIGDEKDPNPPSQMLQSLGLKEKQLDDVLENLMDGKDELETMIQELHS
ncbi:MAG: HDOD domain-containing protein [Gammaproteobacteria bacterium]|nr:HDOD domain-containing protein [Gammaproteobacteria bacterium]MDH5777921.1 HDOD domain-containing protein [Gammaproteobacteria bacterium]